MAFAAEKKRSYQGHSSPKSTVQEKKWVEMWVDRSTWPSLSVLKVPLAQEESWWQSTLSTIASMQQKSSLQRIDLTDLSSKNRAAIGRLQELEQSSLFTTGDLYYILFPSILAKDLMETVMQVLEVTQETLILVNPPKKLLDSLSSKKLPILDLSVEKPWDKKERWTLFAQALIRKRLHQGLMRSASQELAQKQIQDLLSHWPYIWKQIEQPLMSSTATSRLALQQEGEKIALYLVKNYQSLDRDIQESLSQKQLTTWVQEIQTDLLYYPNEESVWEISTAILDQDTKIFDSIDRWIEKDPSAIMTASVLRKQWSQALVWMGKGQVPAPLARSRKKEQMQQRWQKITKILPSALTLINASIYSLKNGANPKVELQRLMAQLFSLCRSQNYSQ